MMNYQLKQLGQQDTGLMQELLDCFGEAFGEPDTYGSHRPDEEYWQELLGGDTFVALVALNDDEKLLGGLTAYELKKPEQPRSELYIYDLAVTKSYRRQGVATALIQRLRQLAAERGAWVAFVQADYTDEPALKLYTKLGAREEVLHFDLPIIRSGNSV